MFFIQESIVPSSRRGIFSAFQNPAVSQAGLSRSAICDPKFPFVSKWTLLGFPLGSPIEPVAPPATADLGWMAEQLKSPQRRSTEPVLAVLANCPAVGSKPQVKRDGRGKFFFPIPPRPLQSAISRAPISVLPECFHAEDYQMKRADWKTELAAKRHRQFNKRDFAPFVRLLQQN